MDIYKGLRSDEWGTPPELLQAIGLTDAFDVCASAENHKFPKYWTKENNCLSRDWPLDQWCWMNPPFSQAYAFFKKAANEAANGVRIVAIYKASNLETKTWQEVIFPYADKILILNKRTEYVGAGGRGVPFGSALIFYNCEDLWYRAKDAKIGTMLTTF
jgi:phage N-6-adenine-methyltransferase